MTICLRQLSIQYVVTSLLASFSIKLNFDPLQSIYLILYDSTKETEQKNQQKIATMIRTTAALSLVCALCNSQQASAFVQRSNNKVAFVTSSPSALAASSSSFAVNVNHARGCGCPSCRTGHGDSCACANCRVGHGVACACANCRVQAHGASCGCVSCSKAAHGASCTCSACSSSHGPSCGCVSCRM